MADCLPLPFTTCRREVEWIMRVVQFSLYLLFFDAFIGTMFVLSAFFRFNLGELLSLSLDEQILGLLLHRDPTGQSESLESESE